MTNEMAEELEKMSELIEEGDKDGMLNYMKTHTITPEDYNKDCYYYPTNVAARFGHCDIFNVLVEVGYSFDGVHIHPIFEACSGNHVNLVRNLVEVHGINPSTPHPNGGTTMTWAMGELCMDVVKYLISAGVSVNQRIDNPDFEGINILHYASIFDGCDDICKYLISVGADIEAKDAEGNTPLHTAAEACNGSLVQILLDAGAAIDARNMAGDTPFLVAAKSMSESPWNGVHNGPVTMLYKQGSDPTAMDSSGKTALHYAMNSYKQAYFLLVEVNLLPSSPNDVKELFNLAVEVKCKSTINLLLNLGYDPWHIDDIYGKINSWDQSEKEHEVMKNLQDISTTPRRLADLCCFSIRRFLGTSLSKAVEFLPVTEHVKAFLRLNHLSERVGDDGDDEGEDETEDEEVDNDNDGSDNGSDDGDENND